MACLTTYAANEMLDHATGTGSFTSPAAVYGQLVTTATTDSTAGTAHGSRVALTFGAASGGEIDLSSAAAFTVTAGTEIVGVEVWDASSSGNRLLYVNVPPIISQTSTLTMQTLPVSLPASSGWSVYAANKVLDHLLRNTSWTAPTAYLSMETVRYTQAGVGTPATGITRQAVAFGAASSAEALSSAAESLSPSADAEVIAWSLWDASSSGNLLVTWPLFPDGTSTETVVNGDTATWAASDIALEAS